MVYPFSFDYLFSRQESKLYTTTIKPIYINRWKVICCRTYLFFLKSVKASGTQEIKIQLTISINIDMGQDALTKGGKRGLIKCQWHIYPYTVKIS